MNYICSIGKNGSRLAWKNEDHLVPVLINPFITIIICTCNRAEHLQKTLAAMAGIGIPDMLCELIIVDNGSTDHTKKVVASNQIRGLPMRYIPEARRGLSYARNTGTAAAQGEIILFTDDDVHPPVDWIESMCAPILSGQADAVAGGVRFAPHLLRFWQTPEHRSWLASTEKLDPEDPGQMIGANMAFSREVLTKVPSFDCEIGPGLAGSGEEALFSFQVKKAGFRIVTAFNVSVEHHFEEARLSRSYFLAFAQKRGEGVAYVSHHWSHESVTHPFLFLTKRTLRLWYWRLTRWMEWRTQEGMPLWEMAVLADIHFYKQYLQEVKRPRNYEKFGLTKLTPETARNKITATAHA